MGRSLATTFLLVSTFLAASPAIAAEVDPAALTPAQVNERMVERRAIEAVIWGMPAVNYDLMLREMLNKTDGKVNQFIYWGRPLDWRNQTLTPNPDAIYFMTFFNTKEPGPVVLEVPPAGDDGSLAPVRAGLPISASMALMRRLLTDAEGRGFQGDHIEAA